LWGQITAYRKRGLVRALFEMVHERNFGAKVILVQAITGIPYFPPAIWL